MVVLGHVVITGQRTVVGDLEEPARLNREHLTLVLVWPALPLARPSDQAARLPVGLNARSHHVLGDLVWVGHCGPNPLGRGGYLCAGSCLESGHCDLLGCQD